MAATTQDITSTILAFWNPATGEVCPPHCIGTDEEGRKLYQGAEGWEPVSDYWLDEDGLALAEDGVANRSFRAAVVGDVNLTTEEQAHMPAEELLDAAMAEAERANIDVAREDIRITRFTL